MENAASLSSCLNPHKKSANIIKSVARSQKKTAISYTKTRKDILKASDKKSRRLFGSIEPQPEVFSRSHRVAADSLTEEHKKINNYLSTIEDPLWKRICQDVVTMMGPASALKIWRSKLGPLSSQDKVVNITCETEETATFVQQYDFVILGSVQKYFPVIKQLKAQSITAIPCV